jgi:hypothetical protein
MWTGLQTTKRFDPQHSLEVLPGTLVSVEQDACQQQQQLFDVGLAR